MALHPRMMPKTRMWTSHLTSERCCVPHSARGRAVVRNAGRTSKSTERGIPEIQIRLANTDEPLPVNAQHVRACSGLASALGKSATVWDLSGLLIEGEPVKRQTVVTWLDLVYKSCSSEPYEQQLGREGSDSTTATVLFELLALADSVQTNKSVYLPSVAKAKLRQLKLQIHVGGPPAGAEPLITRRRSRTVTTFKPLRLALDGRPYTFCNCRHGLNPEQVGRDTDNSIHLLDGCQHTRGTGIPIPANSVAAIRVSVIEQVEKLLYISCKLQLKPLQQQLHMFIAASAGSTEKALIPDNMVTAVYSPRVLEAAGYNEEAGRKAWILAEMQQHTTFLNGPNPILTPNHEADYDPADYSEGLAYPFKLNRDWAGMRKGEHVHLQLDTMYWFDDGDIIISGDDYKSVRCPGMLSLRPPQI